jgi:hypothetical protein
VENTPSTGKVEAGEDLVGITGFTRNTAAGDPYVKYVGSLEPTKCVDLCWGVASGQTWKTIQGVDQTMTDGMPWMNVQRPQKSLGQKMKFVFKHALSQLNVQIDADVNTNQHGQGADLDANTKVFVRSITFSGFAMKGALNLNNEDANTPNWKGYNCNNEPIVTEEYTIYDGLKDGKEGTGYVASNEKVTGLNEKIIQDKAWNQSAEGVTKTAKNLFNSTTVEAPIYVIPTGDNVNVTIVYDIETEDANLAGTVSDGVTPGVSIENRISKTITIKDTTTPMSLEAGKKYTIQLHLGLSQVEFDAEVSEWQTSNAGEAWLPGNGEVATTGVALSEATVGMFVGADGKAYASKDDAVTAGTTAEAYIAYKSATTGASRAIALTNDAPGGTSWNAFNSNPGWNRTPSRDAISGATWQWPTRTDFVNMLGHLETLSTSDNGVFPDGYSYYWSSTEDGAKYAYYLLFGGSHSAVGSGGKDNSSSDYYVRAVLAF